MVGCRLDAGAPDGRLIRRFHRIHEEVQIDFQAFLLEWPAISGICACDRPRAVWALVGEYGFSEERLQDTAGIKLPKLAD
jgi:hypothetical protein